LTPEGADVASQPAGDVRPRRFVRGLPAGRFARQVEVRSDHLTPRAGDFTEGAAGRQTHAREGIYRCSLALADVVAVVALVLLALPALSGQVVPLVGAAAVPATLLLNKALRLYDRDDVVLNKTTLDDAPLLAQAAGVGTLELWLALDAWTTVELDADDAVVLWGALFGLFLTARFGARTILRELLAPERCLVIGETSGTAVVEHKIAASRVNARVVAALRLDDVHAIAAGDELAVEFRALLQRHQPDRAIIAPEASDCRETLELIRIAKHAGVRVTVVPQVLEVVGSAVEFDQLDGLMMLGVRRFGLSRSSRALKRVFDLLGTTVLLAASAPWMLLIAAAIRLDSRGPVLFRQTRVGKDGRRFQMLKFRSMSIDADERKDGLRHLNETSGLFKIHNDPRVTRLGRLLRCTCLDELPQLLNVMRGEMSLVGPRPLVVDEDAMVTGYYRHRLHLMPGMTGPWQILGAVRVPMSEMVAIDYMYVANWSLWTDVKVLLRTIPFVLSRRGF
jgi:exopolysaccharide biosynthesis polyprenyl glycosylphosphotransferase